MRYLEPVRTTRRTWIIQKMERMVLLLSATLHGRSNTDTATAEEIEKLRQEAQALKQIKEAMGSDSFPKLLFNKVYKDDIIRLRSMEEMWKTRRPPEPLDFATIFEDVGEARIEKDNVIRDGQIVWTLQENVVVFKDR